MCMLIGCLGGSQKTLKGISETFYMQKHGIRLYKVTQVVLFLIIIYNFRKSIGCSLVALATKHLHTAFRDRT